MERRERSRKDAPDHMAKNRRRQDHARQLRFQGLFGQLGRLLLTLVAVSFGSIDRQTFQENYAARQAPPPGYPKTEVTNWEDAVIISDEEM